MGRPKPRLEVDKLAEEPPTDGITPAFVPRIRRQPIAGGSFYGVSQSAARDGMHWTDDRGARTLVYLYESGVATARLRRWAEKVDPHEGRLAALDTHTFKRNVEKQPSYLDATPFQFRAPAFLVGIAWTMLGFFVPGGRQYEYDDILATIMGVPRRKQIPLARATFTVLQSIGEESTIAMVKAEGRWLPPLKKLVSGWAKGGVVS